MDRKKILVIAVLLFALTASYRLMNPYRQVRVDNLTYTQGMKAVLPVNKSQKKKLKPVKNGMMIHYFLNPLVGKVQVIKNPFMIPAPLEINKTQPGPEIAVDDYLAPEPDDPSARVGEELGNLKIMGYYKSHGDMAVFIGAGADVLVLKKGDLLHARYRVMDISESKITLKALEINENVIIDISRF